jgi:hypothetical protein
MESKLLISWKCPGSGWRPDPAWVACAETIGYRGQGLYPASYVPVWLSGSIFVLLCSHISFSGWWIDTDKRTARGASEGRID